MNLPRPARELRSKSGCCLRKMNLNLLLLLGLWISNSIIGCKSLPQNRIGNSISKSNEISYEKNYAVALGAPLLIPLQDEVILDMNADFTLRCESNESIVWKYPLEAVVEEYNYEPDDKNRAFGITLTLKMASHMSVGPYYCIKESDGKYSMVVEDSVLNDLTNNNMASSIYIFVNDTENLLVPMPYPVIYVQQFQDAVIPCKPSMPNVDVILTIPNGKTLSSDSGVRYNPRLGFVIEVRGFEDHGGFVCRPKIPSMDNEEESTDIETILGNKIVNHLLVKTTTGNLGLTKIYSSDINKLNSTSTSSTTTSTATALPVSATVPGPVTNRNIVNTTNSTSRVTSYVPHRIVKRFDINGAGHNDDNINYANKGSLNNTHFGNGNHKFLHSTTSSSAEDYVKVVDDSNSANDNSADSDSESFENISNDLGKLSSVAIRKVVRQVDTTTWRSLRKSQSRVSTTPQSLTEKMEKPNITSTSKHHALVGETFQLICQVMVGHQVTYKVEWIFPKGLNTSRVIQSEYGTNTISTDDHTITDFTLTVTNAQISDAGKYTCNVTDHSSNKNKNSYEMVILEKGKYYIDMYETNGYYNILTEANNKIKLQVIYKGYPQPTLAWFKPDGSEISVASHSKYNITTLDDKSTLTVFNSNLLDSGLYRVKASNGEVQKVVEFTVLVKDKPIVTIEDVYVRAGEKAHIQCRVKSYEKPLVTWAFQPCSMTPRWPSCSKDIIQDFNETSSSNGDTFIDFIYDMHFVPRMPGLVFCAARNKIDFQKSKAHILVRDIDANIEVYGIRDNDIIALGDEVTITCAAVSYYFSNETNWFYENGSMVEESPNIKISSSFSEYSYKKSLTFRNVRREDEQTYECRVKYSSNDTIVHEFLKIKAHEPSLPHITESNLGDNLKMEKKLGESIELTCESAAIPKATITWYKDDVEIQDLENQYTDHLNIHYLKPEDQGHYKCVVANRLGVVERTVTIKITNIPGLTLGWIAGIVLLLLVLIGLVIYLCIRVRRERKLLRELKAAGLANFEEGAVEHINPALSLDEQADLLPYDRAFEFPRDKLKLGKQLGAGAFGVVLKADAEGIRADESESVVAVKMVKRNANNEVMRALVSELKIMVHLGQHLNVVNLLGAVTKNIAKRELMVIVEFCRYGNVQNFLMRNRKRFINQINPQTGKIDPAVVTQRFSDNFELNRNTDNDPRSGTRGGRPGSTGYITQSELYEGQVNTCGTEQTVMTTVPEDDDNVLSNNSIQPAWRSNYKSDSTEAMSISTTDLISWCFQVACGMEYLSSKKVLHGDLAARNILLCEDNIVKICDFGLARSMYLTDNYKKQGDAPLPIKWLALESLSDHIFSTYTDVWSFGIVMWELFSLAKVPYPDFDANQSLYLKLKDGYRMERPPYANDDLYDIMLECWSTNPERRPLFNVLKERFAILLGEEMTNLYMDLNEPYLRVNTEYIQRNQTDYLALMGSPVEMAPSAPKYVNGHILPEIRIHPYSDDYLQMSPETDSVIFSPTRTNSPKLTDESADQPPNISTISFNFPDSAAEQHSPTLANNLDSPICKSPRNKKEGIDTMPEEIPMLANSNHEQPLKYTQMLQNTNVPTPSPRHHIAETKLTGENDENYVNVKSPKHNNGSKVPEAYSNPSYQILKTATEKGGQM